jgi:probable HAF family extracellular repeat protein
MRYSHIFAAAALAALLSGCGGAGTSVTPKTSSQLPAAASQNVPQYHAVLLSSLGGFLASGISVNQQSVVGGFSVTPSNTTVHATLWTRSSPTTPVDLSTLGGDNSAIEWPNHTPNEAVGISQIATIDPLGEHFSCSAFLPYTSQECRGFVYTDGVMTPLGTLGGNNSFATGSNAQGQIVGWAETTLHDPTCVAPQVLQFLAVVWDRSGNAQVLPPLAGDSDTAADAINNRGDAVGISGICENAVGALSAEHMVLWHNRVPTELPSLGGAGWNTPEMINDEGDVVGFSNLPGDQSGEVLSPHAFLWTRQSGTIDLGLLPGDVSSFAYSINDRKQIVGQSCAPPGCVSRAVLFQNGQVYDLNALLDPADSGIDLIYANDINDQGEITGLAVDTGGNLVGFLLVPDGTISPQSVRANSTRPHASPKYQLRMGAFGRPIITR